MPTVVATAGSATANSFITTAEGDTFADERLQTTGWTGASADDKARAVIQATTRVDGLVFEGEKAASGQALKWPRILAYDDNDDEYDTDAVPDVVKRGTFEAALWLLNKDGESTDAFANTGLEQFKRAKVGPVEVEPNLGTSGGELPDHVLRILRPVLRSAGLMSELVRS